MTWEPDYCTEAQLRTFMRLPASGSDTDSVDYTIAITAASRAIDRSCNRQFGVSTATARYYTPHYSDAYLMTICEVDDFQSVTSLVVKSDFDGDQTYESTIASTGYRKRPYNAAANGRPWTLLEFSDSVSTTHGSLEVTALWGWTAVPDNIVQATLLQASRLAKRRDAPFGVAGSPDMGNELRLLARLDPDVEVLIAPFRRYT